MQILHRRFGPAPRLEDWEARPFAEGVDREPRDGDHRDSYTQEIGHEEQGSPAPAGLHAALAARVLSYVVFPPSWLTGVLRRTPVQVGDTIGILYHAPAGIELFFAARVTACFDGPSGDCWRTGFTYRTLRGHPELGEETFAAEKDLRTGAVSLTLRSWSRPGTWLACAFAPIVRRLQVRASHAALAYACTVRAQSSPHAAGGVSE